MDAILYVDRTGIPWRYLPHDFALWETVYGYFVAWQKHGVFDQLNGLLRRLVRKAEGRDAEPSACVLDCITFLEPDRIFHQQRPPPSTGNTSNQQEGTTVIFLYLTIGPM
jgi:transposase